MKFEYRQKKFHSIFEKQQLRRHESIGRLAASLEALLSHNQLRQSVKRKQTTYRFLIIIQCIYAFMLVFYKQLAPSFKADYTTSPPPPHPSPPPPVLKRESLACVQRSLLLPGAPSCLPHQTFILSLCLLEIITARPMIGRNTVMDVWCICFRGFFYCIFALFIITPAHC